MAEPEAHIQTVEIEPGKTIQIETGRLAKQADGSVVIRQGDTMVLCTAVIADEPNEGQNFFPLTVDYREKFAAGGRIPGGFIKREGRPTDKETLSSRLIDRAIRPLFPDGFYHETQVIGFVVSADEEHDADVLAGLGGSAALMLAGAPFDGPIAEVRVGRVDGEFVTNPTLEETEESDFNLIVAGKEDTIVMVEGEMDEVSEEDMLEAIDVAHEAIRKLCRAQHELVEKVGGVEPLEYELDAASDALVEKVRDQLGSRMADHIRKPYEKEVFYGGIDDLKDQVVKEMLGEESETAEGYTAGEIREAVGKVESSAMRDMILRDKRRLDGRGFEDIRELWMEVGYLPRVHGSAVFTRGETQVLGSVTLGSSKDVQPVDQIFDREDKRFFLHYRFPPFSVGEARFLRGPKRREIGHGMLAERALQPVLPGEDAFPYTIRVNAEVLESNGSSSMASVCAGSLALMDAGVPIEKPVAGIAMGLVHEGDETAILTDILGTEDHLGDMDFKITGTRDGVTACQMDIKTSGLSRSVLMQALEQARSARGQILDAMEQTLPSAREEMSDFAPRLTKITIDAEFIGAVIGPGGSVVKSLQRETDTTINIEEEEGLGFITISATNKEDAEKAINRIKQLVAQPEEGEVYEGTVKAIKGFGALVEIMPEKVGLLHISEFDHGYVENVEDYVAVGDKIKVKLLEVRNDGKMRLSRKPFLEKQDANGQEG